MKVLVVSADDFEDTELLVPYYRLNEEGIDVDLASISKGKIRGKHGYEIEANKSLDDVKPEEYDMLVLPGGKAPAVVRKEKRALDIVRHFFEEDKPVSAICHGPQILISAGLLTGRRATCYKTVVPELKDAGVAYEDKEVVVDGQLVTSRQPSDLPAFMRETMKKLRGKQAF